MKIKAKHVFVMGAFIVLTLVGYVSLPRDEIVINVNNDEKNIETTDYSGNIEIPETIYVHIEGAVNNPGIKKVPKNTRLFELIEVAGGELEDADISKLNLASILRDEQKVYVPYKEKLENNDKITEGTNLIGATNVYQNDDNILVNINLATKEELQRLDGIGPSMANKIIEYRESQGYFTKIEDIKNVSGIGESKFNKIKNNITI